MHHVSPVPLPFKHDGDETKPLTEDANCIDALGRIEGRMGELLACMTELAGNLKEPSDAASDAASDAERSGGAKLPAVPAALPAALPAQPCCRTWHRAMSRKRQGPACSDLSACGRKCGVCLKGWTAGCTAHNDGRQNEGREQREMRGCSAKEWHYQDALLAVQRS